MIFTFLIFVVGFIVVCCQLSKAENRIIELEMYWAQGESALATLQQQHDAGLLDRPIKKVYWAYPQVSELWHGLPVHLQTQPQMYDSSKVEEIQIIRYE